MPALIDTIQRERAGRLPMGASAPFALSCSSPVHNQHQGRGTHNPRALHGGYGCHQSGFSLCLTSPCELAPVSAGVLFQSHRRAGFLLPSLRLAGAVSSRIGRPIRATGSSRSRAHTLRNKPCFQHRAYALHFLNRLSSSLVLVGIDPNENGLTYEAQPLPPGGKAYD